MVVRNSHPGEWKSCILILITQRRLSNNCISGLKTKSHRLLAINNTGRTKACLLVKKEFTVFLLTHFSNEDVVTGRLEDVTGEIWLISAYLPHDNWIGSKLKALGLGELGHTVNPKKLVQGNGLTFKWLISQTTKTFELHPKVRKMRFY